MLEVKYSRTLHGHPVNSTPRFTTTYIPRPDICVRLNPCLQPLVYFTDNSQVTNSSQNSYNLCFKYGFSNTNTQFWSCHLPAFKRFARAVLFNTLMTALAKNYLMYTIPTSLAF